MARLRQRKRRSVRSHRQIGASRGLCHDITLPLSLSSSVRGVGGMVLYAGRISHDACKELPVQWRGGLFSPVLMSSEIVAVGHGRRQHFCADGTW